MTPATRLQAPPSPTKTRTARGRVRLRRCSGRSTVTGSQPRLRGERLFEIISKRLRPVHPHASGERFMKLSASKSPFGSPPRERGEDPLTCVELGDRRFTPARAGRGGLPSVSDVSDPVHPRASGERCVPVDQATGWDGSPPRDRGEGTRIGTRQAPPRFTPARAGRGRASASCGRRRPVHPRASGERDTWETQFFPNDGSSPRERGEGRLSGDAPLARRFIPARAGRG